MDRKLGGLTLLALTGCASMMDTGIPSPEQLHAATRHFVGQPAETLLPRYGYPHQQTEFGADQVLLWHTNRTLHFRERTSSTTTGAFGDPSFPWAQVPYTQSTTGTAYVPNQYHCTMQVAVNPATGKIRGVGFVGKMGACQEFMP